jgi:hypothetical protein
MKRLALILLLELLAGPFAARAEDAPSPVAAAIVAEKPAQSDAAQRAALSREVVQLFGLRTLMSNVMTVTSKTILPIILEANPGQDARIEPIITAAVQKAIMEHMGELEGNRAAVYADYFTVGELEQLRDFYQSPVGQKLIKVTPDMMARSAALDHDLMIDAVRAANKEISRQLKKNGMKVPKDIEG